MPGDRSAFAIVRVEELDPPTCSFCALERSRVIRATHEVVVEGWVGPFGAQGRMLACERHAEEAASALRKSMGRIA